MGGVVNEINRLVHARATEDPWPNPEYETCRRLIDLASASVRADVIAGASAGGINGTMLALAQARHAPLDRLRDVWLDNGAFGQLFRSPLGRTTPSLLQGDEYFLPRLREALLRIAQCPGPQRDLFDLAGDEPIDLSVTTTTFSARRRLFRDDYSSAFGDATHRGLLRFRRGRWINGESAVDQFAGRDIASALALASRSSASFPFAFEPSLIPIGSAHDDLHPNMGAYADFDHTTFAMDGGVLVNKPLRPVLRAVMAQPAATERVRRLLVYVVPDPGETPDPRGGKPDPAQTPSLARVGFNVVGFPRVESLADDFDELSLHNQTVDRRRLLRRTILDASLSDRAGIEPFAEPMFKAYHESQANDWIEQVVTALDEVVASPDGFEAADLQRAWHERLRHAFVAAHPPQERVSFLLEWDPSGLETVAEKLLAMLGTTLRLRLTVMQVRCLGIHRRRTHLALGQLRLARAGSGKAIRRLLVCDPCEEQGASVTVDAALPSNEGAVEIVKADADARLERLPTATGLLDRAIREGMRDVSVILDEVGSQDGIFGKVHQDALALLHVFRRFEGRPGEIDLGLAVTAEMIDRVVTGTEGGEEGWIEHIQVSAYTPNVFDERRTPESKLAGVQLGHFGGFYKRSWRANDWMWGRMDAVWRLAQVLLRPKCLRESYLREHPRKDYAAEHLFQAIERVVLAPGLAADPKELMGWTEAAGGIMRECRDLINSEDDDAPRLDLAHRAIAKRLQYEIALHELPALRKAMKDDVDDGADPTGSRTFVRRFDESIDSDGMLRPEALGGLITECRVAHERVLKEAGSPLFTRTATTAAAVATSMLQGSTSKMNKLGLLRGPFAIIRGFALALWAFARSALRDDDAWRAIALAALALGGALAGVSYVTDVGGWVTFIGGITVAVAVTMLMLSIPSWVGVLFGLGIISLAISIALLPQVLVTVGLVDAHSWIATAGRTILGIAALIVGTMVTGWTRKNWQSWAVCILGLAIGAGLSAWTIWYDHKLQRGESIALGAVVVVVVVCAVMLLGHRLHVCCRTVSLVCRLLRRPQR